MDYIHKCTRLFYKLKKSIDDMCEKVRNKTEGVRERERRPTEMIGVVKGIIPNKNNNYN